MHINQHWKFSVIIMNNLLKYGVFFIQINFSQEITVIVSLFFRLFLSFFNFFTFYLRYNQQPKNKYVWRVI